MKCIKDFSPSWHRGHFAQLSLVNDEDQVICRSVFNLDYLEKIIKALKKDIGKSKDQRIVELQFVRSKYSKKNGVPDNDMALVIRATTATPQFISGVQRQNEIGKVSPEIGYYGIAPIVNIWSPMHEMEMLPGIYTPANFSDPCNDRDCDQCEIGGCDHDREVS